MPDDVRGPSGDPLFFTNYPYPGCLRHGILEIMPTNTNGFLPALGAAITPARVQGDSGLEDGAVVVWNDGGTLRWGTLTVQPVSAEDEPPETRREMTATLTELGDVTPSPASTDPGSLEPELVLLPATGEVLLVFRDGNGDGLLQATLAEGDLSWSPATPVTSLQGEVAAGTAVSLVADADGVRMAFGRPLPSGNVVVDLRATEPMPDVGFLWTLEENVSGSCTRDKPGLSRAPDLDDPTWQRLFIASRRCWTSATGVVTNQPDMDVFRQDVLTGANMSLWAVRDESPVVELTEPNVTGPALIYDARPEIPARSRGLRLYQTIAPSCVSAASCAGLGFTSTCTTFTYFLFGGAGSFNACTDASDGTLVGFRRIAPFLQRPEPGYYADYDDWQGLAWGFCETRAAAESLNAGVPPPPDGDYVRVAYGDRERCGTVPQQLEPRTDGMFIMSRPPANDRALHPEIYEPVPRSPCQ